MADEDHRPAWERGRRRGGGNPLVGLIVTLLALFGALTAGLGIAERSVGEAGDRIDGWISTGWNTVTGAADDVDEEAAAVAEEVVQESGEAVQSAGEAVEGAADEAAENLSRD
jgi:hypothetical protein